MSRDRLIALGIFIAGIILLAMYYFSTLPGPVPPVPDDTATVVRPQIEITIEGQANGVVVIELFADVAPLHVERIVTLARAGTYDGVVFHRVIDRFMAQTGDVEFGRIDGPRGRAGQGGSDMPDLAAEFSEISFEAGIVGMARANDPNSANSQFFIVIEPARHLDGKYTVVGKVVSGLELVRKIKLGVGPQGTVIAPQDVMVSVRVVE
jgi:peptidylprolyl isomerase